MNSLPELLRLRAREAPTAPFLFFKDLVLTRQELDASSDAAAASLSAQGVVKGDRVALLLGNSPEFIFWYFGAMKLGAVAVPINTALKEPEIKYILDDCGAKAVIRGGEPLEADGVPPLADLSRSDPAAIIYTSGTTGFPKGAVLTHGNYLWDVAAMIKAIGMTEQDRFLCFLPLFHVNGQVVTLLGPLYAGASMVLMEKFTPKEFLDLLGRHRCTAFSGVPSVYSVLLSTPSDSDLSSLRFCICGAAPMPVPVFEAFEKKFNARILEGYGLSEGSCVSSVNPIPPGKRKIGSIGLPLDGQEMKIFDNEGAELSDGQIGEIVVKGPNVMAGYWGNPEATGRAIGADGYLRTGDLGLRDEEGYFFIKGRKKEMIIRGGENIYPKEIEEALYKHPAVAEAAVVGLPHKRWGEEVAAFIVLKEGAALSGKDAAAFLKDLIADYKLPRRWEFPTALPKTATGKIQKHKLRAEFS